MVAIIDYSTTLEKLEEYEENRPLRDTRYYKEGFTVETEIVKIWIVGSKMKYWTGSKKIVVGCLMKMS
jgi:hypothetical protein